MTGHEPASFSSLAGAADFDALPQTGKRGRRQRGIRRGKPIHAYVGPNGGGKSLAMVFDTLPSLDAGRTVLSTVPLYGSDGNLHPCYVPFSDFRQLLTARACDVLMDEVTGVASSRESHSMPVQVANFLVQLRRRDVVLRWTSPNFRRADVIMRECTQAVTECRGFAPVTRDDGQGRMWRDRRLFLWRTYDAADFDDWSSGKRDQVKRLATQVFWRPGSSVERAYNTLDAVEALGAVNEAGRCMVCWGKRAAPRCSCTREEIDAYLSDLDCGDDTHDQEPGIPAEGAAAHRRASAAHGGASSAVPSLTGVQAP